MNLLYEIFIHPLEVGMHWILSVAYPWFDSYGLTLIFLSLLVNVALLPLYHMAQKIQETERQTQARLKPKLDEFRKVFSGKERFMMIKTLYRQHGYHPIYALRTSLGLLVQIPFFIAAYHLLSNYQPLEGVSFLIIKNLNRPDALLGDINVFPFVMTGINLLSAFVYSQKQSVHEKIQLWCISLLFLVLLYSSASALLIYWTANNIFSLLKNLAYAQLTAIQKSEIGQARPVLSHYQNQAPPCSLLGSLPFRIGKEWLIEIKRVFQTPYFLALLVGLYPVLFFVSNNWFVFEGSEGFFILGLCTLFIFLVLSTYYVTLTWFARKLFPACATTIVQRLFVPMAFLLLAFQLRLHILPMVGNRYDVLLFLAVFIAFLMSWLIPKIQIFRVNGVLFVMCVVLVGSGFNPLPSAGGFDTLVGVLGYQAQQELYEGVKFSKKPNVYYIVPDGYPNRETLAKMFRIENSEFYQKLDSLGFNTQHLTLSNYRASLPSVSSTFGMGHHFYGGGIEKFERLKAERFIASEQNPVVHIFKNNGYQVHFVHSDDYLFRRGCLIDSCSPNVSFGWGKDFLEILLPRPLLQIADLKNVIARPPNFLHEDGHHPSQPGFMERVLAHIEVTSRKNTPNFTYIHFFSPGHSLSLKQTPEQLGTFRKNFFPNIKDANEKIIQIVNDVLVHDPNALIIINADHGPFGFGLHDSAVMQSLEQGVPHYLLGLDQLGVLLSVRSPDGLPSFDQAIQTNVNVFRHLFSYLSDREDLLATLAPNHGFILKGRGRDRVLVKVAHEGKVLEQLVEVKSLN